MSKQLSHVHLSVSVQPKYLASRYVVSHSRFLDRFVIWQERRVADFVILCKLQRSNEEQNQRHEIPRIEVSPEPPNIVYTRTKMISIEQEMQSKFNI